MCVTKPCDERQQAWPRECHNWVALFVMFWLGRNHQRLLGADDVLTSALPQSKSLVVEDNIQERVIDVNPAVVPDKAQLLELVHEQIDARSSSANHFRQRLLRNFGK